MPTEQDRSFFKVIILGSGLAGSLLANGLIHNNVNTVVYERTKRHAKREGYQIRLGAPALEGMRACLSQEQINTIVSKFGRSGGMKSSAPVFYSEDFRKLIDLTRFPVYSKSAPINRGILRDSLADPVFAAGILQYERSFERYEILNPGSTQERVRVWFEDGGSVDCDVLIGADGSHSKVNRTLGLNNISQVESHISMSAKNDLPTKNYLSMTPALRETPIMAMADNIPLYFCAYLPDKSGDDGKMAVDETLSSSMFGIHIPADACPADIWEKSNEEKWDIISCALRGWAPEYHEILNLVKGSDIYLYRARVSKRPAKDWRAKVRSEEFPERGHPRVWLMGDAMHAMLPTRGMGGNQSMRDAATILPLLVRLHTEAESNKGTSVEAIAAACREYEDEMIPRTFEWVAKSGGSNLMPIDTSTLLGMVFMFIAAQVMNLAYVWYSVRDLISKKKIMDDAPELKD
ncbi:hypothetical protein ONS95_002641 [Cadophora gregata]|uniref:uncharacterized protein n=1 Tax=Cadophora gregata TaxID=51156 RepID=UPI0026DC91E8|nr:uncharacterized protein ONS95_002641 [Cadophora gregata]KAK0109974.1 hypothetical protein ONS95_002641 [Cadophora gregata]KAK0110400.1 hypothetical protein ONS96_002013 [Cadophora gregata f. sp. sojae]